MDEMMYSCVNEFTHCVHFVQVMSSSSKAIVILLIISLEVDGECNLKNS
jgi:hypothetical protein